MDNIWKGTRRGGVVYVSQCGHMHHERCGVDREEVREQVKRKERERGKGKGKKREEEEEEEGDEEVCPRCFVQMKGVSLSSYAEAPSGTEDDKKDTITQSRRLENKRE